MFYVGVEGVSDKNPYMVQGFCEGQTTQERTKTLRYTDHITRQLMQLEQLCTFAWWEPGCFKPTPQEKTYKYKVCAATMHKCRANLFGMQQALSKFCTDLLCLFAAAFSMSCKFLLPISR